MSLLPSIALFTLAIVSKCRPNHSGFKELTAQSNKYIDYELGILYRDHFGPVSPEQNKMHFLVILLASLMQSNKIQDEAIFELEKKRYGAPFFIEHGLAPPNVNLKDFKRALNKYRQEWRQFKANKTMHFDKATLNVPTVLRAALAKSCADNGQCPYGDLFDIVVEAMVSEAKNIKHKINQMKLFQVKAAMLMTVFKRFRMVEQMTRDKKDIKWLLGAIGDATWPIGYVADQMASAYKHGLIGQSINGSGKSGNLQKAVKYSRSPYAIVVLMAVPIVTLALVIILINRRQCGRDAPSQRDSNESP